MLQSKVFDKAALMFDADTTWYSTGETLSAYVDLGGADLDQLRPGEVIAELSSDTAASAGATILFQLKDCDQSGGTYAALTPVQVTTAAIPKADVSGVISRFTFPIPRSGVRRYLKFSVTVATAAFTAGKLTAGVVK